MPRPPARSFLGLLVFSSSVPPSFNLPPLLPKRSRGSFQRARPRSRPVRVKAGAVHGAGVRLAEVTEVSPCLSFSALRYPVRAHPVRLSFGSATHPTEVEGLTRSGQQARECPVSQAVHHKWCATWIHAVGIGSIFRRANLASNLPVPAAMALWSGQRGEQAPPSSPSDCPRLCPNPP